MTQVLIDRATLEQLVDCPASDYERMYALKKQLHAALGNVKRVELDASTIGELEHAINIVKQKSAVAV